MKFKNDAIGNRMKNNYENITRYKLIRRSPIIIRIDGKSFHNFTKGFDKPFDPIFTKCMQETTKALCEQVQNCVFGYVQSDEISLLLLDYKNSDTNAWFDNNLQKMCSVSASIATLEFNKQIRIVYDGQEEPRQKTSFETFKKCSERKMFFESKLNKAMFDSRVFNIPKDEIVNYFIWRQQDATRNSILGLGAAHFNQKELDKKNTSKIQDMLILQKNINWNDCSTVEKRGSACIKVATKLDGCHNSDSNKEECLKSNWLIDKEMPILTQNRNYLEQYIF